MKTKNIISLLFNYWNILLYFLLFSIHSFAQTPLRICAESTPFYEEAKKEQLEKFTENWIKNPNLQAISRGKLQIPVVVHIVYQTEEENISDEQVWSQMDALNKDFNRENDNLDKVPSVFQSRIAEVGFEFCLASIDPNGMPTNGITRTSTSSELEYFPAANWIYYTVTGGKDAWNTAEYLNIWVTKTKEGNAIGFGSRPFQNPEKEDGIIVAAQYFGTIEKANPPFHLGKTATHEVGHYFNLLHPWGQETNCNSDDLVADTPLQSKQYNGCPAPTESSCDSQDITANFMNFSDDECLAMFTYGQALRMQAALIGARKGLLASNGCGLMTTPNINQPISVYPNPARSYFCIETHLEGMELIPFEIMDTKGAIVQKGAAIPNGIQHFSTLPNGFYFIRLFPPNQESVVKKLIIVQ